MFDSTSAARDVLAEQFYLGSAFDDAGDDGLLVRAALYHLSDETMRHALARSAFGDLKPLLNVPEPSGRRGELVRAAALLIAEIARLDMATTAPSLAPD